MHWQVLCLSCLILYLSYEYVDLGGVRRLYVLKNVIKSCVLCVLVLLSFVYLQEWDTSTIRCFAALYVSNDLMALLCCRHELSWSTICHHVVSVCFMLVAFETDFEVSNTAQMLFFYTYASAWTFPVNLYLGLRCVQPRVRYLNALLGVCRWWYPFVCVLNWLYQLYRFDWSLSCVVYASLLTFIVYDDIVLVRWLYKQNWKV